jgi:YtkA-like
MRKFIAACPLLLLFPSMLHADGGTVCFAGRVGPYRVTVFTAPTPLRAGPVDISMLVQDPDTGKPVPDARVVVRLTPGEQEAGSIEQEATQAAATNKLLQATTLDLPTPGLWHVTVVIEGTPGTAKTQLDLQVAEPLPRWLEMMPWIAWPIIPIFLYALLYSGGEFSSKTRANP